MIFFIAGRFVKPIEKLADATRRIGAGEFNYKIPSFRSDDEIAALVKSFSLMQVELQIYIKNLKETTAQKEKMESEQAKKLMKLRAQSVEPVYGDIKENSNFRSFLLRGLEKVRLEFSIICTSHNIKLIINKIRQSNQNYRVILGQI